MIDDKLKPWLLEVNLHPSFAGSSPLDMAIKSSLLADTFHLIGLSPNPGGEVEKRKMGKRREKKMISDKDIQNLIAEGVEQDSRKGGFVKLYPLLTSIGPQERNKNEKDEIVNSFIREPFDIGFNFWE